MQLCYTKLILITPAIGVTLIVSGLLGFVLNTLNLARLANIIPQATALALGVILGTEKMSQIKTNVEATAATQGAVDSTIEKANDVLKKPLKLSALCLQ